VVWGGGPWEGANRIVRPLSIDPEKKKKKKFGGRNCRSRQTLFRILWPGGEASMCAETAPRPKTGAGQKTIRGKKAADGYSGREDNRSEKTKEGTVWVVNNETELGATRKLTQTGGGGGDRVGAGRHSVKPT